MTKPEMKHIEGRVDPVKVYWLGKLAIYFCNLCETQPTVGEGEVAVSVAHDECRRASSAKLHALGSELVRDTKANLFTIQTEVAVLKRDIGRSNPN